MRPVVITEKGIQERIFGACRRRNKSCVGLEDGQYERGLSHPGARLEPTALLCVLPAENVVCVSDYCYLLNAG